MLWSIVCESFMKYGVCLVELCAVVHCVRASLRLVVCVVCCMEWCVLFCVVWFIMCESFMKDGVVCVVLCCCPLCESFIKASIFPAERLQGIPEACAVSGN